MSVASKLYKGSQLLTKEKLLDAIQTEGHGYFPYSSEDTFELLRCETTRYSIIRVPVEFVKSFVTFAAHLYLRSFDRPSEENIGYIDVVNADQHAVLNHLRMLDNTDDPAALKFKNLALRGLDTFDEVAGIYGKDPCTELVVARSGGFYVAFLWFTTG
jgi:hypothetical protein